MRDMSVEDYMVFRGRPNGLRWRRSRRIPSPP